jgi:hypothetical protein
MSGRLIGIVLIAALAVADSALAADDFTLQQRVNACHAIGDRDARVACYDRLAGPQVSFSKSVTPPPAAATPLVSTPSIEASEFPSAPQVAALPRQVQSVPPSVAQQSPPPAPPQPDPAQTSESLRSDTDEILIAVSSISSGEGGALSFVTSDGIPWVQTDEKRIRKMPAPGDLVKISRGYLGYMCKFSSHEKIRCKPPNGLNGRMNLH